MGIFTSSKTNNYFSSYIDIKAITAPSSPNSGIGRLFYNTSTGKLSFKKSNGTVVDLESGGGGGGTVESASNVGTGSGWFKTLNGTDLEFKSLIAGSTQLSITSNVNDLTLDVVEANIKLDDLGAPDDNTDLNASATKHGLLPKLSGNSTDFLTGQGTWAVPAGGGGGGGTMGGSSTQSGDAVTTVFTIAHGIGSNPNAVSVEASSIDALGDYQVDHDATNITITYQSAPPSGTNNLVWIWMANVGGAGEANTYSSAGVGGVGITLTKVGVDLPFKSINTANSSNITVTNDAGNSEIDIDIGTDVMTASSTHTMTNKTFNADGTGNSITNIENADIKAAAGIVYSKLTLTDSVVNADVNSAAAIAYSKLNLVDSIVNADINSAAAIATSKLADSAILLTTTNTKTVTNKTIDAISNTIENTGSFKYTIFKDGSTYYCKNNVTGAIEVSNADPLTVLQFPLTNGGSCWVQEGDYELTGAPSVYFDFPLDPVIAEFYMAANAWIVVPNAYTGTVFRLQNSDDDHCTGHRLGVNIKEAGTPTLDWTGILIESIGSTNSRGIYDCRIDYANLFKPNIGIKFNNATGSTKGFITTNYINNVNMWTPKTAGVDFVMDETYSTTPPNINGIHRNRFRNVLIQGNGSDTTVGFRNIRHKDNSFYGCYAADFTGNSMTATIHTDANSTIIDGGSMTITGRYTDSSSLQTTKIRDEFTHTQFGRVTPGINGVSIDIVPTGVTNTTSWWNSGVSERFWIQKNSTDNVVYVDSVKQTAGGTLRPVVFRMNDVTGPTTTESYRIEADAGLRVFTDKFRLRDSNNTHNYNFLTGNLTADRNITYPVLTGNDVPVFEAHTATLTNKTVNLTNNTVTDTSTAAGDLAKSNGTKFVRFARGTANQALVVNSGATDIEYATLTSDHIASTDALQMGYIRNSPTRKKRGLFVGTSSAAGDGILAGGFLQTGGTAAALDNTNGPYHNYNTGAVSGNTANIRYSNPYSMRQWNPYLGVKFLIGTATNNRIHIGFKTTPFTAVADGTDDPLANISGIMLVQRAADTVFQICSNNGGANSTFAAVAGNPTITANTIYTIEFRADEANTKFQYSFNSGAWTDITTTIPAATTNIGVYVGIQTAEPVIHSLRIYTVEVTSDK